MNGFSNEEEFLFFFDEDGKRKKSNTDEYPHTEINSIEEPIDIDEYETDEDTLESSLMGLKAINEDGYYEVVESDIIDEGEPLITFEYDLTLKENDDAFRIFQKKYVMRRSIIYTIIFLILAAFYLESVIKTPNYTLGYGLLGVCIAIIFYVWYNPVKIRRKLIEALSDIKDDRYTCEIYDEYIKITTILPEEQEEDVIQSEPTRLYFAIDDFEIVNSIDMFIIYVKKQVIYILPKRCIEQAKIDQIDRIFAARLGNSYSKAGQPRQVKSKI
ncbi:MAG: hypothetical protein GX967_02390 [Clostridiales bacterium]|nr:hypothetical protein [Clostridiales bacterium]